MKIIKSICKFFSRPIYLKKDVKKLKTKLEKGDFIDKTKLN